MSVRVMSWVFDHSTVEHRGDLLVLLVLADHASDDGDHAYPSVETISRKARLSERGARLALRNLETAGAITPTGRGPKGTVAYKVLTDRQPLPPAATSPGSDRPEGGHSHAPAVSLTAPEPSRTTKEPPREHERSPKPVTYNGKRVPPAVVADAEKLCAVFAEATGRTCSPRTSAGAPTPALKQIIGATLQREDVPLDAWEAAVRRTVANPPGWAEGRPLALGDVFGERAAEHALAATGVPPGQEAEAQMAAWREHKQHLLEQALR